MIQCGINKTWNAYTFLKHSQWTDSRDNSGGALPWVPAPEHVFGLHAFPASNKYFPSGFSWPQEYILTHWYRRYFCQFDWSYINLLVHPRLLACNRSTSSTLTIPLSFSAHNPRSPVSYVSLYPYWFPSGCGFLVSVRLFQVQFMPHFWFLTFASQPPATIMGKCSITEHHMLFDTGGQFTSWGSVLLGLIVFSQW